MKKIICYILVLLTAVMSLAAESVSVAALRGPTSMGLAWLMDRSADGVSVNGNTYSFQLEGAADAIVPMLVPMISLESGIRTIIRMMKGKDLRIFTILESTL